MRKDVAKELSNYFLEIVIAPKFSKEALSIFGKKKNLRLLEMKGLDKKIDRKGIELRSVVGGYLAQDRDVWLSNKKDWKYIIAHEIKHYTDYLDNNFNPFTLSLKHEPEEIRADVFAQKITNYKPSWR